MTLIQSVMCMNDFVIVTTDSLCKKTEFSINPFTGKMFDVEVTETFEKEDKAKRLTDNVLFSTLGWGHIGDELYGVLKQKVQQHFYLDDCKTIFQQTCWDWLEGIREQGLDKALLSKNSVIIQMIGFKKDGSTGFIEFNAVKGFAYSPKMGMEYPIHFTMLPPTQDLYDKQNEFYAVDGIQPMGDPISTFLGHMYKIHSIVNIVQSDGVSPQCIYHILTKEPDGNIKYIQNRTDLTPFLETLPTKEVLLDLYK